jgi:hypothetical protein
MQSDGGRKTVEHRGEVPDWAALTPVGAAALGAPSRPIERLMGVQAAVYRLIVLIGDMRLPRSAPRRPLLGTSRTARSKG